MRRGRAPPKRKKGRRGALDLGLAEGDDGVDDVLVRHRRRLLERLVRRLDDLLGAVRLGVLVLGRRVGLGRPAGRVRRRRRKKENC